MDQVQKRLRSFLGQQDSPGSNNAPPVEEDFADFAGAPDPSPASILSPDPASVIPSTDSPTVAAAANLKPRPYTKWYRIWERVYVSDFYLEFVIFPLLLFFILVHLWGARKNRRKVKAWLAANGPVLQQEFAHVGFGNSPRPSNVNFGDLNGPLPANVVREKAANEYISYASGRLNVAFVDIKLTLKKRFNPMARFIDSAIGFFFENMPAVQDRLEATAYVFDGREDELVAIQQPSEDATSSQKKEKFHSSYDGFVWAVVHKDMMNNMRNKRYDLSLTVTKDHPKLPVWATVMSENAEITEALLTDQLVKAINETGEAFEALIITDQPLDRPQKLNDAVPKKRVSLSSKLPPGTEVASNQAMVSLFSYFLRLPDTLSSTARFRPDVMRRVKLTREEEIKKIKKTDETEKSEERRAKVERDKKKERDDKIRGMGAEEQKKFLEKERAQELRKSQKSRTMRA